MMTGMDYISAQLVLAPVDLTAMFVAVIAGVPGIVTVVYAVRNRKVAKSIQREVTTPTGSTLGHMQSRLHERIEDLSIDISHVDERLTLLAGAFLGGMAQQEEIWQALEEAAVNNAGFEDVMMRLLKVRSKQKERDDLYRETTRQPD